MGLIRFMTGQGKAFATLAAACLLLFVAALVAASVLGSQQLLQDHQRAAGPAEIRFKAWKDAQILLASLQGTWNPVAQSLDSWWLQHATAFSAGTELVSLSGRINLNSMTPFLLKHSELSTTLLGRTVEEFVTYRTSKGPFSGVQDYTGYFKPSTLNAIYCVHSFFNVNTADEIILEKVLAARTGNEALASRIRARLREFRTNRQVLMQSDWDTLIGADKDVVGDLLTLNPEVDVNTASIVVLRAILKDPDFKLDQPDAKLQSILAARASKPLDSSTLQQILAVPKNSLLLQYIGTRSFFLQGRIAEGSTILTFVAAVSYSSDQRPKVTLRILDTSWTGS